MCEQSGGRTDTQQLHVTQEKDRWTDRRAGRQTERHTDWQADGQAGRQAGRLTDRQTDRQKGRQTDRQTDLGLGEFELFGEVEDFCRERLDRLQKGISMNHDPAKHTHTRTHAHTHTCVHTHKQR